MSATCSKCRRTEGAINIPGAAIEVHWDPESFRECPACDPDGNTSTRGRYAPPMPPPGDRDATERRVLDLEAELAAARVALRAIGYRKVWDGETSIEFAEWCIAVARAALRTPTATAAKDRIPAWMVADSAPPLPPPAPTATATPRGETGLTCGEVVAGYPPPTEEGT